MIHANQPSWRHVSSAILHCSRVYTPTTIDRLLLATMTTVLCRPMGFPVDEYIIPPPPPFPLPPPPQEVCQKTAGHTLCSPTTSVAVVISTLNAVGYCLASFVSCARSAFLRASNLRNLHTAAYRPLHKICRTK